MSQNDPVPPSGFGLERVCFIEQHLRLVEQVDDLPDADPNVQFGWDWRITGDRQFEVILQVQTSPTRRRPEEAAVLLTGQFVARGEGLSVPVVAFVSAQAPAILLPWARECISSLTGRGFFGQFMLPPLNVLTLMSNVDKAAATGARQLATEASSHGWAR
ncbi:MAG: protein-export chaperone SecB [Candidatus Eisenbacteria bacterium]|nr:protein-export chaperone SecB [Candidatus Eisenbacteria bacterium]